MGTHTGNVITLANSIVGVSVLAMPFCFKQCGILLAILMLLFSNVVTRLACHYLMKSAIMEKRKNFEMLAFRVYGPTGKLLVELCTIGFLLGTCVAYFVIMGDLGPGILGPAFGFQEPTALRPSVLIAVAVFVVLPLGLLKNVDSLSAICAATVAFYVCLVLKVMGEAVDHLIDWDWMEKVYFWRPSGILQCIPIFSMALSCQTQLFEIFDSLPSNPLDRMNAVVKSAINMVTLFYISVGLFGYIAYCDQTFSGNLMMNFSPTITSDVIKIGFLLSVAVSFPLVIFPCRASIYSLVFSKGYEHAQTGSAHIPESRFKCITLVIVTASLVTGLLIPNIEIVLGLVGSTIGVIICVIIPGIIFTSLSMRNNNERLVAKFVVCTGLVILVLGTYANLYATEEAVSGHERNVVPVKKDESPVLPKILGKVDIKDETLKNIKDVKELAALPELKPLPEGAQVESRPKEVNVNNEIIGAGPLLAVKDGKMKPPVPKAPEVIPDTKKEPPVPEAPEISSDIKKKPAIVGDAKKEPPLPEEPEVIQNMLENSQVLSESKGGPNISLAMDLGKGDKMSADGQKDSEIGQEVKTKSLNQKPQVIQNPKLEEPNNKVVVKKEDNVKFENEVNKPMDAGSQKLTGKDEKKIEEKKLDQGKVKEIIIEKIKEHEEAQRKLNEEGIKLLKEIKDYVNDSLKIVNVKTGVISEIKDMRNELAGSSIKKESANENGLASQMAKGIPLPLAVKGKMSPYNKEANASKIKENGVMSKHDTGRDLLGEEREVREKRDVEGMLKEGFPLEAASTDLQGNESSVVPRLDHNVTSDSRNRSVESPHSDTKLLPVLETGPVNCVKNGTNKPHSKVEELMSKENKMDQLIKSPSYLSNSNPVLNAPQLLSNELSQEGIPEMPKKRDLKSVNTQELSENKQNN